MTKLMKSTAIPKSTIILCADDFGLSAGVNRAILDLVAQKRLSAISCMSLAPAWEEGAEKLKLFRAQISAGLHLTLTYLPPLTKEMGERHPPGKEVVLKSWLRLLDKTLIEKELRAQFEKFIAVWGAPPDFIDGHQHVHVLPVVRDIVLRLRNEYAPKAWMRNVVDFSALQDTWKYGVLVVLGWRWLQMLKKHGIPHNKQMRGAYNYNKEPVNYAVLMTEWCTVGNNVLIYCHPGFPDAGLAQYDPVLEPRRREYNFFSSSVFGEWLEHQLTLAGNP
jgi:predicted glycoside hydrolase/deacetylase ChbG (UPF0249 family)